MFFYLDVYVIIYRGSVLNSLCHCCFSTKGIRRTNDKQTAFLWMGGVCCCLIRPKVYVSYKSPVFCMMCSCAVFLCLVSRFLSPFPSLCLCALCLSICAVFVGLHASCVCVSLSLCHVSLLLVCLCHVSLLSFFCPPQYIILSPTISLSLALSLSFALSSSLSRSMRSRPDR